ncbi:MAG: methanobactin biosynthesis protein MbnC [Methylocystis sp.]
MILLSLPRRTDRDLYPALMSPEMCAKYPADDKAFVRIDTSLRVYWHTLFDICPELLELSGPDGLSIFRPFMAWAGERKLAFDWFYYLWVYVWLRQSPFKEQVLADKKYLRSVMGASAARWAILDRGRSCGIAIGCVDTTDLVIGWKCRSVRFGREIELIEPAEPLPPLPETFAYFTLPSFELDIFPGWQGVTR